MDWTRWTPRERATLCFIRKEGNILLIRKKRGLGAGKINAPGGRIDPGETALAGAIRETIEEVGVVPLSLAKRGELHFDFADGYSLHCTVFLAAGCEGDPIETEEAIPFWVPADEIPYPEMWADDAHWLPLVMEGKALRGFFTFDSETMLTNAVEIVAGEDFERNT